jgi:1,4-alpha-glucan branching enzyme
MLACVANFAAVPHENYRIGLPAEGAWSEILNTDAETYYGSGVGNLGAVSATGEPWHGLPVSTTLRVPPLGTLWLRFEGDASAS